MITEEMREAELARLRSRDIGSELIEQIAQMRNDLSASGIEFMTQRAIKLIMIGSHAGRVGDDQRN